MKFYKKLQLKKLERTKRKLVFRTETGELAIIPERLITSNDINIDQIFYAEGVF